MPEPMLQKTLDRDFRQCCRIILGSEIGGLEDNREWLQQTQIPSRKLGSVYVSGDSYSPSAKFIPFSQIDYSRKISPIPIDRLKDIESIIQALQEQFAYAGDIVLGNCSMVEKSTNITDSHYIIGCNSIWGCNNLAYSSFSKNCRYMFGTHDTANSSHMIRSISAGGNGSSRVFESRIIGDCSDIYYSHSLYGCSECFFSFFQRGKRHLIGNLELSKDKYLQIKKKLLEEIVQAIKSGKHVSIDSMFGQRKIEKPSKGFDLEVSPELQKAYSITSKLVLGKELDLESSGQFLTHSLEFYDLSAELSAYSRKPILTARKYMLMDNLGGVFIGHEDELEVAEKKLTPAQAEGISLSTAEESLKGIAFASMALNVKTQGIDYPIVAFNAINSHRTIMPVFTRNTGFCFWPRNSENLFGCSVVFESSFSLRCYGSTGLKRCFEVDSSKNSFGSYYCHNVENVNDSLFCFNSKNLSNAVGNTVVGPERFKKTRAMLQEWVNDNLEKKKEVQITIFNLGKFNRGQIF